MPAPFRDQTRVRIFAFFVEGCEIKIAVFALNDLGVKFDLAFALTINAGLFQFADHVAMVDHGSGFRCVLQEMRRSAGIPVGGSDPDVPGNIAPGAAPDRIQTYLDGDFLHPRRQCQVGRKRGVARSHAIGFGERNPCTRGRCPRRSRCRAAARILKR